MLFITSRNLFPRFMDFGSLIQSFPSSVPGKKPEKLGEENSDTAYTLLQHKYQSFYPQILGHFMCGEERCPYLRT